MMHFVNWTNQLAIHQSALMRGIVDLGWRATMVVNERISSDRRALGWDIPDFEGTNIIIQPNYEDIDNLIENDPEHTIHAFGAALSYQWGVYALYKAMKNKCKMGIISEASDPDGWKGSFRLLKCTLKRMLMWNRVHFIFAMGMLGVQWFRKCGYPMEKIFPFGYFVEQFDEPVLNYINDEHPRPFQIIYAGALISRKRVDLLIKALGRFPSGLIQLTIIGDGVERTRLEKIAKRAKIAHYIRWLGILPHQHVSKAIAQADLFILPSRYDGWGAVVNEALMSGTPVICSDHCGAADLLMDNWRGEVVPRNNLDALVSAISRRVDQGPVSQDLRARIRDWSMCITGKSAALYLQTVLDHVYNNKPKPNPPWLKNRETV